MTISTSGNVVDGTMAAVVFGTVAELDNCMFELVSNDVDELSGSVI